MPKAQWRTFSIRVNAKSRKAVGVQARFPLSVDEWAALFAELEKLKAEDLLGEGWAVDVPVPVSVRMVEKLAKAADGAEVTP